MATKPKVLVAREKVLVALATVSVAISSTGLLKLECSYAQNQTTQLTWKSSMYGTFFLSKFNLSLVFTNDLRFLNLRFVLFNLDIRFSTSTFVLFNLDIRFSTSTFVLFNLDIRFSTLTFVSFRRYGRELVLTLSTVVQVQHSCYSIFRSTFVFSTPTFVFEVQHSCYRDIFRDVTPRSRGVVYICGWQRHDVA